MTHSVLDLFSIGIGPSSSHTVGPMRAAHLFANALKSENIKRITCELYGSLALTGRGHGTQNAVIFGLSGFRPEHISSQEQALTLTMAHQQQVLNLNQQTPLTFNPEEDVIFLTTQLMPKHSNGMKFNAYNHQNEIIHSQGYYSVGGGFICLDDGTPVTPVSNADTCPFPFNSAAELISACKHKQCSISQLMWENERCWRTEATLKQDLLTLWLVMNDSIESGLQTEGVLPGGLNVPRRAPKLYAALMSPSTPHNSKTDILDWLSVYAMAVNEENAAGGRVVTAPTNGAAGIIPAVLKYYIEHLGSFNEHVIIDYLLTAGAIGILYKEGASLSAAEVGCQGEVGVACSMAAGALAAIQGGSIWQVENAAEIGMEHNLGLTCDPIGGLVQIPCIERNTMGAVKAVNAARLALNSDGHHVVSLDKVIATMMRTGKDMQHQYKETSLGGLAIQVNMPEC
ncbi:L-serine ammonia-lyase [Alkalimarinus alittae]|uniref:L-serine dehydratase n=1 Tax=Alkalimarinus alittae TaxID=2961619 RepID=A0ABY6N385_9ALTE|nr:L-serine ammonia-lyase [Alkalimarinus alittae]UZE96505.1 L-serine ammonia-lyase [Alkalimarinus alittae]